MMLFLTEKRLNEIIESKIKESMLYSRNFIDLDVMYCPEYDEINIKEAVEAIQKYLGIDIKHEYVKIKTDKRIIKASKNT